MPHTIQKSKSGIISFLLTVFIVGSFFIKPTLAQTTDYGLIQNGIQQFFDNNGNPLSSGKVYFYEVGTTTFKNVYTSSAGTTAYTNPITLNAAGRPPSMSGGNYGIYGTGLYRQVLKDRNGNQIWDAVTSPSGSGGSTPTDVGDGNSVGTILPWSGLVAPNQYVFAYGQEIARSTYPEFYTAITQQANVICTSASNTLTGLVDTTQIRIGSPIELSLCVVAGTTVVSKTASSVTLSNPSSVSINAVATFFPFGNGNGSTTFNVPDLRGYAVAGRDNMGGTAASRLTSTYFAVAGLGAIGGSQSHTLTISELAAHRHTITDPGHTHTVANTAAATAGGVGVLANGGSSYSTASATTGITQSNLTGNSDAFSIVQPTITINYVVKITPDTSTSIATGVYSIGGMTGVISCGTGLLCTGNYISVNQSIVPGSGTSGGVLFWSDTVTISSSGILSQNNLVIGGGAGFGPTTINCATSTTVVHGGSPPSCSQIVAADITTNTITNSNLSQVGAARLKGNPTASTANVQDFTIQGLTATTSPSVLNDYLLIYEASSGTIKRINPSSLIASSVAGVSSVNSLVGGLTLNATTGLNINSTGTTITITPDTATTSNFYAGTANKLLDANVVFSPEVAVTYASTTVLSGNTFINASITLNGNINTLNCNNFKAGQAGTISFVQDSVGSRTAAFNTGTCSTLFKFPAATFPTLTTSASAIDVLSYSCRSSSYCAAALSKGYNP